MYPILFPFGSFTISSFGVMMVIAFLLGNYLLRKDVVAEGYDPIIAEDITFRAAIGGILGAKLYYLIENIPTGQAADNINGLINIIAGIFTLNGERIAFGIQNFGAGLVFMGGLVGGIGAVSWYIHRNKLNWFKIEYKNFVNEKTLKPVTSAEVVHISGKRITAGDFDWNKRTTW